MNKCDVMIHVTTLGRGGTERYAKDLAIGLVRRKLRPCIVYDHPPEDLKPDFEVAGIPTFCINHTLNGDMTVYASRLADLLDELKPSIFHATIWDNINIVSKVLRLSNIPMVITRHGPDRVPRLQDYLGINRVPFYFYKERAAMRRSGGLICGYEEGCNLTRLRFGRDTPVRLVYTGVPLSKEIAAVAEPREDLQIVWVGEMCDRKRPLLALRAFQRAQRSFPKIRLLMLGDGEYMGMVRNAVDEMKLDNVQTPGYIRNPMPFFLRSHLLLQTACAEGLAYVVKEALSVGLPVVATDAGGTREAVIHENTGLLAHVDDEDGLTNNLVRMLNDNSLRTSYGKAGLALCRAQFSLDEMVLRTLATYKDFCGVTYE